MPLNLLENPHVPRYIKIAEQLEQMIVSGQLKPGDRLPSFSEMKAKYGAGQNTMERVHALLEKQDLIIREQGRGTFVSLHLGSSTGVKAQTIGIAGEGFSFLSHSFYWGKLLQGIRKATSEAEVQLLFLDHKSAAGWEKVDGALITSWEFDPIRRLVPPDLPCVAMLAPQSSLPSVTADDYQAGRLATEYLLQHGHQKIAFLHGKDLFLTPRRIQGYVDALRDAGIKADPHWRLQLLSPYRDSEEFRIAGQDTMHEWMSEDWREIGCTALICQNDDTAVGAIEALTAAGVKVPQDVSVIGFDGTEICDYFQPNLTAVEMPLSEIGECAVKLLLEQIEQGKTRIESCSLPTRIKIGKTVESRSA